METSDLRAMPSEERREILRRVVGTLVGLVVVVVGTVFGFLFLATAYGVVFSAIRDALALAWEAFTDAL